MPWYVLQTNRNKERLASAALQQRGVATYLPRLVQWPPPVVGGAIAPLFPGYVFADLQPERTPSVATTPGVRAFVSFGGVPASIGADAIAFLRSREGPDGLIRGAEAADAAPQQVRIVNGPFRGLTAVLESRVPAQERVRVLMRILRSDTSVELPARWVRLA
jgi:transcriptional antiterminator RfaH